MQFSARRALFISLGSTALGALLLHFSLDAYREREAGGAPRHVVAVTSDLAPGDSLTSDALTTRALPSAYVESRHILGRELADIVGTTLAVPARAGETLLWSDLSTLRSERRQLSTLVPPGMRALNLDLQDGDFDDLLSPGDRVDVIQVDSGGHDSQPVAHNLLVLAVGRDLGSRPGRRQAWRAGGHVALAVTPDQGRRLAEAERRGNLRLLLRHPDDVSETQTTNAAGEK